MSFGHIITNNKEYRIVMVGKTGIGKSASGNSILGRPCFVSKCSSKSLTTECSKGKGDVDGLEVAVIDTPGLFDTRYKEEQTRKDLGNCISYASPGPHIFLVIISLGRFTQEEKQAVEKIQEIFGAAADKYSMVLFTHGDQLDDTTIEEFLDGSPDLQELVSRCNGQYHVFNNKLADKKPQVRELLQKIKAIVQKNGGSHYTNQMFQEAERVVEEKKQKILREQQEKIRKEKEEIERAMQQRLQQETQKLQALLQAERERERREREAEMQRMQRQMNEERKMEREARDAETRKMYEMMNAQRQQEREAREAERQREREDRQREMQLQMDRLNEEHIRQKEAALAAMQENYERQARQRAEDSSGFCAIL